MRSSEASAARTFSGWSSNTLWRVTWTALRERMIGAEMFGRPVDYDTSNDAVVRVRATEVRKRLAQYYREAAQTPVVRIDLPSGSYVPEFHWSSPTRRQGRACNNCILQRLLRDRGVRQLLAIAALLVTASLLLVIWLQFRTKSEVKHSVPAFARFA